MNSPKPPLTIEISKSAIIHNINFVRQLIGEDVTYGSVVKGNAYGHGIEIYCKISFEAGVKNFAPILLMRLIEFGKRPMEKLIFLLWATSTQKI